MENSNSILSSKGKVLYIPKGYIDTSNNKELENILFVKDDFSDELLAKIWQNYDFDKAEKRLFELQCKLTTVSYAKNLGKMRRYQDKIVYSSEARMLAIRKIAEISKSKARNRRNYMEKRFR